MNQAAYYYGTGRRKTSIARVRLLPGNGTILINGKSLESVVNRIDHQATITEPLRVTQTAGQFNVQATVQGGGVTGQAGAVSLGIARALIKFDENLKAGLRKFGLVTRDPRVKERKKYGLKRARKAPQYTKR
ncbi:MAG TPA: 30S ribosomal protein S9 [Dehalococcoidia bacterium]|nr:30S ribosomal protein S9 [Dehalococcoidia bacterium]